MRRAWLATAAWWIGAALVVVWLLWPRPGPVGVGFGFPPVRPPVAEAAPPAPPPTFAAGAAR